MPPLPLLSPHTPSPTPTDELSCSASASSSVSSPTSPFSQSIWGQKITSAGASRRGFSERGVKTDLTRKVLKLRTYFSAFSFNRRNDAVVSRGLHPDSLRSPRNWCRSVWQGLWQSHFPGISCAFCLKMRNRFFCLVTTESETLEMFIRLGE